MADEVVITWNATNWITIVLMAAVGFVLLGSISTWLRTNANASKGA